MPNESTPEQILLNAFNNSSGEEVEVDNDDDQDDPSDVTQDEESDQGDDVDNNEDDEDDTELEEDDDEEDDDEDFDEDDDGDEADDDDDEEEPEEGDLSPGYLYHDDSEDRDIFLRGEDPVTGETSVYLTRDEAQAGLSRQLEFIGELKKQVDEAREEGTSQVSTLQGEVELYRSIMTQDAAKAALIEAKMPTKFKGIDPTTLTVDNEIKDYKLSRIDAEVAVEREIREAKATASEQAKARNVAKDRANKHVRTRSTDLKFFGLKNVEDRMTISRSLNEKSADGSEQTVKDVALVIAETFGDAVADAYLKGAVVVQTQETTKDPAPKKSSSKKKSTSKKTIASKAKKIKSRAKKQGGRRSSTLKDGKDGKVNARSIIVNAFKNG